MPSVMSGENQTPLTTLPIPSLQWSMVVAASRYAAGTGRPVEGKMNVSIYRAIPDDSQSGLDLRVGVDSSSSRTTTLNTAYITKE